MAKQPIYRFFIKFAKVLLTTAYAVFCFCLIYFATHNKYEWMLDDPLLREENLTFCRLPIDSNLNPSLGTAILTFIPLFVLLVIGAVQSTRKKRMSFALVAGLLLLVFWAMRIYRMASCP